MWVGTRVHLLAWSWHFIAGLRLQSPGFNPMPVNAGFVMDELSLGQILLLVVQFSSVCIIPPILHIHESVIYAI